MDANIPVRIAIGPFPGGSDDYNQRQDGIRRECGVGGCDAQVTFWCETSGEWVCWLHGQLVLKKEWGLLGHNRLVVKGTVQDDVVRWGATMEHCFAECEAARVAALEENVDVDSPEAQALVDRYMSLVRCKKQARISWGKFQRGR